MNRRWQLDDQETHYYLLMNKRRMKKGFPWGAAESSRSIRALSG